MKKNLFVINLFLACFILFACESKRSAKSIAQKWCDLNAKVYKAPDGGPEYAAAKEALDKYEKDMEAKYEKDEAFMKEIEKEVNKCEDASEGR